MALPLPRPAPTKPTLTEAEEYARREEREWMAAAVRTEANCAGCGAVIRSTHILCRECRTTEAAL